MGGARHGAVPMPARSRAIDCHPVLAHTEGGRVGRSAMRLLSGVFLSCLALALATSTCGDRRHREPRNSRMRRWRPGGSGSSSEAGGSGASGSGSGSGTGGSGGASGSSSGASSGSGAGCSPSCGAGRHCCEGSVREHRQRSAQLRRLRHRVQRTERPFAKALARPRRARMTAAPAAPARPAAGPTAAIPRTSAACRRAPWTGGPRCESPTGSPRHLSARLCPPLHQRSQL